MVWNVERVCGFLCKALSTIPVVGLVYISASSKLWGYFVTSRHDLPSHVLDRQKGTVGNKVHVKKLEQLAQTPELESVSNDLLRVQ